MTTAETITPAGAPNQFGTALKNIVTFPFRAVKFVFMIVFLLVWGVFKSALPGPAASVEAAFKKLQVRLSPPKDEGLIWWLIRVQRTIPRQIGGIIGFVIIFKIAGFSWQAAIIMLASMYFHELGHGLFFVLGRIKIVLMFLFPLGAVAAPANKEENERSDKLSWFFLAFLMFGGPLANLVLMVVGHWLINNSTDATIVSIGRDLVFINGLLGITNMFPIWKLDAGQYFKLVYSSLPEAADRFVSLAFMFIVLVWMCALLGFTASATGLFDARVVLLTSIQHFGLLIFLVIFVLSNLYTQGQDKPEHCESPLRMTPIQFGITFIAYFAISAGLLLLSA